MGSKVRLIVLICVTLFSCSAAGQRRDLSILDKILTDLEKRKQVMGSIAFSENGVTTYARAFGFSKMKTGAKADTLTKYRIGSVSKLLTATMILQLVSEAKLNLDDKLSRFFPKWPNADKITMKHLLRHESGIFNFGKSRIKKYQNIDPQSKEEIKAVFENAPVAFSPGKNVDYNNANYVVLSLIIEEIDKSDFAESLQARIIKPLYLKNTHAGGYLDAADNEASSYFWKNGWIENEDHYSPSLLGAGALVSTPGDLNVFLKALFTHEILPEEQLREMMNLKGGMGLGLYVFPFYGKSAYGHSGNIDSFEAFSAYFPEENIAFSILLNANRKDFNKVLVRCLREYFGL
ncbi:MAG: serine hydrolase domain-containing protein [Saprospiraceae bacterium]